MHPFRQGFIFGGKCHDRKENKVLQVFRSSFAVENVEFFRAIDIPACCIVYKYISEIRYAFRLTHFF